MFRPFRFIVSAVLCLAAVFSVQPLFAQANRADSAAILLEATRRLELEGENAAAQELMDLIIRHFPGTPAASEAVHALSDSRIQNLERSGRASLIAFNTLYGAFLGMVVPAAFDDYPSSEAIGAGLLIGAPLGFFGTKAFVDHFPMSSGQATLTGFGARWGTWQGIALREVLDIGDRTHTDCYPGGGCYEWEEESDEAPYTAAILGGLTGMITGGILAQRHEPSHGTATMIEHGALWGTWYGLATSALIDIDYPGDAILTWALVGGNAGLLASALATRSWNIGAGRVRIISAAGLAGGVAGLGLDLVMDVDNEKVAVLIPALTSAIGLVAGGLMTQRFESGTALPNGVPSESGLVNFTAGRWSVGMPALEPAKMLLPDRMRGTRPGLGARVSVFSAKF